MFIPQNSTQENNITESSDSAVQNSDVVTISQNNPIKKSNKKYIIIGIVSVLLVVAGLGIYFISNNSTQLGQDFTSPLSINPFDSLSQVEEKPTVAAPITGVLFDEETAPDFESIRPLGIMVNNHTSARPQSGLNEADITYEVVAEGGITRFLAFYQSSTPEKLGPVRSTREYYLVIVKELGDAMLMHIGWSPQAEAAIKNWPVRSLFQGGAQFYRDQQRLAAGVATEHTAYVDGPELRELGDTLGWEGTRDFPSWEFKDDAPVSSDDLNYTTDLSIDFWFRGDYSSIWEYNPENNTYLKSTGYDVNGNPIPHLDQETNEQVEVKNLIVQFADEQGIAGDDKGRLEYQLTGSGSGFIFIDGKVIPATWSKADRDSRTMFFDNDGNEVQFNRGRFWVAIVPSRNVDQVVFN